jgi:hypothetical protein
LGTHAAAVTQVKHLSFGSLELQLNIPEAIATAPAMFGFVLYAIKRLLGYPVEVRTYLQDRQIQLLEAEHERVRLEKLGGEMAQKVATLEAGLVSGWEVTDAAVIDADE